jgi:hypothetical protein
VYTLPIKTGLRIRKPNKPLTAWLVEVMPLFRNGKVVVELTDFVARKRRMWDGRAFRWFDFVTGELLVVHEPERHFEIEPGYALLELQSTDLTVFLVSFARDLDQVAALDIARDAFLDGRSPEAGRIAREALPHGWPLFLTLLHKERNLGTES